MKLEDKTEGLTLPECIDYINAFFIDHSYLAPIVKKIEITRADKKFNVYMEMQGKI